MSNTYTHKEARKLMDKSLKSFVVPEIKKLGFSGSFPHFRKQTGEQLEFASFQFNRYGGSFVIETGKSTKEQLAKSSQELLFEKLNYSDTKERMRIKPTRVNTSDYWFSFEELNNEEDFDNLAKTIVPLLTQLEQFFNGNLIAYTVQK